MYSFAHLNPARQCPLSSKCTFNTLVAIHKVQYFPLLLVCLAGNCPAGKYHSEDSGEMVPFCSTSEKQHGMAVVVVGSVILL